MNSPEHTSPDWEPALPIAAREVEDFLASAGWDQPPQLFALVPTQDLLAAEPSLADRVSAPDGLTPVAQEPLGQVDLSETLAGIFWPNEVTGCAIGQEIVILPPEAEAELDRIMADSDDPDAMNAAMRAARDHPQRRDARLVVAVLRSGGHCCLLRLRGTGDEPDELVEGPDLAPNLVTALQRTLESS